MSWKKIAAAAVLACACTPVEAWDTLREQQAPHTMVFLKVPLDGQNSKEQSVSWGFSLQGRKEYQTLTIDSKMTERFVQMGFIESKLVLVGAAALVGVFAVASSGSRQAAQQQQQLTQQQQQQAQIQQAQAAQPKPAPAPCPQKPAC